jgi:hypothetical protein
MNPERTMRGDAVETELGLGERVLDLLRGLEAAFVVLQHEIRRLRAGGAGLFGVVEKLREDFAPC